MHVSTYASEVAVLTDAERDLVREALKNNEDAPGREVRWQNMREVLTAVARTLPDPEEDLVLTLLNRPNTWAAANLLAWYIGAETLAGMIALALQ